MNNRKENIFELPEKNDHKSYRVRAVKGLIILSAIAPYGYIIAILSFYFHAKRILGWYPYYGHPDPKELNSYSEYSFWIDGTFAIWAISLAAYIFIYFTYVIVSGRPNVKLFIGSVIGHLIAVTITASGIFEWYID